MNEIPQKSLKHRTRKQVSVSPLWCCWCFSTFPKKFEKVDLAMSLLGGDMRDDWEGSLPCWFPKLTSLSGKEIRYVSFSLTKVAAEEREMKWIPISTSPLASSRRSASWDASRKTAHLKTKDEASLSIFCSPLSDWAVPQLSELLEDAMSTCILSQSLLTLHQEVKR